MQYSGDKTRVSRVLDKLDITPGETVADLGCGGGTFAFAFSKAVGPQGMVYAADIDAARLGAVRQRRDREKLVNLEIVLSAENDANLPCACDLIFMRNVFHHIAEPALYFHGLKTYLKRGGRLAVIDWTPGGAHSGHDVSESSVYVALLYAGYIRIRTYDCLVGQSFNIFTAKE